MITYLGLADKVVGYSGMDPEKVTPLVAYAYVNSERWADVHTRSRLARTRPETPATIPSR